MTQESTAAAVKRKKVRVVAAGVLTLLAVATATACDPSAGASNPPSSPSAALPSASAPASSPAPHSNPAYINAAQQQYAGFIKAQAESLRHEPTGKPPKYVLKFVDPDSEEALNWLDKAYAGQKRGDVRLVAGGVNVTAGPEIDHDPWRQEVIKFKACSDWRTAKAEAGGEPTERPEWQLGRIEMHAPVGLDRVDYVQPETWKVYGFEQISGDEPCEFK